MDDNEVLRFIDADSPHGAGIATVEPPPWRILVVDDDADVHESTAFGLRAMTVEGRGLHLLHAHSAAQGVEMLRNGSDIAVILLDVVMEAEDAGLKMVDVIRGELAMANVRIILRTGQPGQAPEIDTIRRYDINDYKAKSELSRSKLYTVLTAAIRAYDQLRRVDANRRGLEKIIAASNQFIAEQGIVTFAEGVITQIASLIGIDPEGVVCASGASDAAGHEKEYIVIAAAGRFASTIQRRIADIDDPNIVSSLTQCLNERRNLLTTRSVTLFFPGIGDGRFAAFLYSTEPLRDVDMQLLRVFCSNIALYASNVLLVARLREHAFVDRQLGLPNRTAFIDQIDVALKNGSAAGKVVAIVDIDHFTATNDMFGHVYGDLLLAAVAHRLVESLPEQCLLARVAGDSFGIFGRDEAVNPEAIDAVFEPAFDIEGIQRPVTLRMGFARCDGEPANGSDLFKNASIALKNAQESSQSHSQYYSAAIGNLTRERTRMLQGLQGAFQQERLFVVYQPQVALDSGRPIGFEALLRWRNDAGQFVAPDQFIPVAEQSGLIVPIGAWVLRTALRDMGRLLVAGAGPVRMAVNVSSVQFAQSQFLATVDKALRDTGITPDYLELEITESVAVIGMERVIALMQQIKSRGIAIAIDDFGTGFSSLSYLDRLPADRLKIDRAFVSTLDASRVGGRIAELIVPLGNRLGMRVLAEGVETEAQAEILRGLGCNEAQGYLYARPMPIDELIAWLADNRGAGA